MITEERYWKHVLSQQNVLDFLDEDNTVLDIAKQEYKKDPSIWGAFFLFQAGRITGIRQERERRRKKQ